MVKCFHGYQTWISYWSMLFHCLIHCKPFLLYKCMKMCHFWNQITAPSNACNFGCRYRMIFYEISNCPKMIASFSTVRILLWILYTFKLYMQYEQTRWLELAKVIFRLHALWEKCQTIWQSLYHDTFTCSLPQGRYLSVRLRIKCYEIFLVIVCMMMVRVRKITRMKVMRT